MERVFLLLPVLIPVLGGITVYFIPKLKNRLANTVALCAVVLASVAAWFLILSGEREPFVILEMINGLRLELSLDGLGSFFLGLISVLWIIALIYAFGYMKNHEHLRMYFSFYVISYGVTCGIALAGNMLTLFFFYEMLTLVTIPLVIQPMTKLAKRAARKYMYFSVGGSAFAFFGLVCLIVCASSPDFVPGGAISAQTYEKYKELLDAVYVFTFLGFGVKGVVFPMCMWLPSATVAPTPTTALLHAVAVVKSGVFAIIRLTHYSYGAKILSGTPIQTWLILLVVFTILYGSSMALRETHFKRRLAYSTIANLSYILFGVLLFTQQGLVAGLLHFLFHSVIKIGAFFCAGNIITSTGREYTTQYKGAGRYMPVSFICFGICGLSLMGLPYFAGFVSKWQLCVAASAQGSAAAYIGIAVLLISALLTAVYMLSIVINAFMPCREEDKKDFEKMRRTDVRMLFGAVVPSVCAALFGFFSSYAVSIITECVKGVF